MAARCQKSGARQLVGQEGWGASAGGTGGVGRISWWERERGASAGGKESGAHQLVTNRGGHISWWEAGVAGGRNVYHRMLRLETRGS